MKETPLKAASLSEATISVRDVKTIILAGWMDLTNHAICFVGHGIHHDADIGNSPHRTDAREGKELFKVGYDVRGRTVGGLEPPAAVHVDDGAGHKTGEILHHNSVAITVGRIIDVDVLWQTCPLRKIVVDVQSRIGTVA